MERTGPGSFLGGDTRASVEAVLSFPLGPMQLMSFGTLGLLVNRSCLGRLISKVQEVLGSY